MPNLFPLAALAILSLVVACGSSDASGGSTPREGGAQGSGGSNGGTVNCSSVCPAVVAAKCSAGPVDEADCASGCQTILAGKCAPKYQALYQCAGSSATYTCTSSGAVSVSGCESAATDLYTCLASM
jgi:hypothetical protein